MRTASVNVQRTVFISSGTGHARIRRGARGSRGDAARAASERHRPAAVVCAGSRPRWPLLLAPAYWLAERLPATRADALRLGLVTIAQMLDALVYSVEQPAIGERVLEVPALRGGGGN